MESTEDVLNAVVRDCAACSGLGFHLSPYLGPDAPRTKTNCVPCNGFGIKIIRRTAVDHADPLPAHPKKGQPNG